MSRDTHYVLPHGDQWEVRTDNEQGDADFPRYDDREDAVAAAILSAENSYERGRDAVVLVKEADGRYRTEREYDATR